MHHDIMYEPADIIIYVPGKGIVLREKSVMAFQENDGKIVAFGTEAAQLAGKGMDNMVVMSPLRQGRIEDFAVAAQLFSMLITKALGKKPILKQTMVICVPKVITPVEKKVIEDVMKYAGAGEVMISEEPAEKFVQESYEKFPGEYRKVKLIVGITKDEPERYVEEALKRILTYARQEQISQERVCELLQKLL